MSEQGRSEEFGPKLRAVLTQLSERATKERARRLRMSRALVHTLIVVLVFAAVSSSSAIRNALDSGRTELRALSTPLFASESVSATLVGYLDLMLTVVEVLMLFVATGLIARSIAGVLTDRSSLERTVRGYLESPNDPEESTRLAELLRRLYFESLEGDASQQVSSMPIADLAQFLSHESERKAEAPNREFVRVGLNRIREFLSPKSRVGKSRRTGVLEEYGPHGRLRFACTLISLTVVWATLDWSRMSAETRGGTAVFDRDRLLVDSATDSPVLEVLEASVPAIRKAVAAMGDPEGVAQQLVDGDFDVADVLPEAIRDCADDPGRLDDLGGLGISFEGFDHLSDQLGELLGSDDADTRQLGEVIETVVGETGESSLTEAERSALQLADEFVGRLKQGTATEEGARGVMEKAARLAERSEELLQESAEHEQKAEALEREAGELELEARSLEREAAALEEEANNLGKSGDEEVARKKSEDAESKREQAKKRQRDAKNKSEEAKKEQRQAEEKKEEADRTAVVAAAVGITLVNPAAGLVAIYLVLSGKDFGFGGGDGGGSGDSSGGGDESGQEGSGGQSTETGTEGGSDSAGGESTAEDQGGEQGQDGGGGEASGGGEDGGDKPSGSARSDPSKDEQSSGSSSTAEAVGERAGSSDPSGDRTGQDSTDPPGEGGGGADMGEDPVEIPGRSGQDGGLEWRSRNGVRTCVQGTDGEGQRTIGTLPSGDADATVVGYSTDLADPGVVYVSDGKLYRSSGDGEPFDLGVGLAELGFDGTGLSDFSEGSPMATVGDLLAQTSSAVFVHRLELTPSTGPTGTALFFVDPDSKPKRLLWTADYERGGARNKPRELEIADETALHLTGFDLQAVDKGETVLHALAELTPRLPVDGLNLLVPLFEATQSRLRLLVRVDAETGGSWAVAHGGTNYSRRLVELIALDGDDQAARTVGLLSGASVAALLGNGGSPSERSVSLLFGGAPEWRPLSEGNTHWSDDGWILRSADLVALQGGSVVLERQDDNGEIQVRYFDLDWAKTRVRSQGDLERAYQRRRAEAPDLYSEMPQTLSPTGQWVDVYDLWTEVPSLPWDGAFPTWSRDREAPAQLFDVDL